jgi:CRP-like cAMP-binding protein
MLILLRSVCRRLADSYRVIQEYSFDNLPERLAKTLLRLADEIGRETPRGTELTHYITQEELAQMLSVRREVVSSELSRLRARGCVSYPRRGRLVINRAALAAYADALGRAGALGLSVTFGLSAF